MASSESNQVNGNTAPGTNTMVAGIVFQLASLTIFVVCAVDFLRRSLRLGFLRLLTTGPLFWQLSAMLLSVVCIYIRSIYRTIELSQGWSGYLITHESYFIGLDGAMMIIATAVFNLCHPGWLVPAQISPPLPKSRSTIELTEPEAQKGNSTEYTGYGYP